MYNLGKFVGTLINLSLYAGIVYDGILNYRSGNSFVLNIIAFIFFVAVKDIVKALNVNANATEFIALYFLERNERESKKDKINNIFNNITKDL